MSTATQMPLQRTRRGRLWHATLWSLQIATALAFVVVAAGKFTAEPEVVVTFHAIGLGDWFMYFVAALEVLGAAGLLIPRLAGLAAAGLSLLMVGAILIQSFIVGSGAALPVPYLVSAAIIAWGRRHRTVELWSRTFAR